jgi:hypothetical protein
MLANSLVLGALIGLFVLSPRADEQEALAGKYVAQARDLLRTLYPQLNGKGYILSISMPLDYDRPNDYSQNFQLDVGDDYKEKLFGYIGGWQSEKPKDYKPGPIHAKQYLQGIFIYQRGELKSLGVSGAAVGDPDAIRALREQIRVPKPLMTAAEANPILKQAGAKYGLEDREAFVAALPLAELEPFLGKLSVTSVKFEGSDEDDDDVRASLWPNWTVLATARQGDREVPVRMSFEPFKGDLTSLIIDPARP